MVSKDTQKLFKQKAITLWLDIDCEILWNRIKYSRDRPILKKPNPEQEFFDLYEKRKAIYQKADIHVKIGEENILNAIDLIIDSIENFNTED